MGKSKNRIVHGTPQGWWKHRRNGSKPSEDQAEGWGGHPHTDCPGQTLKPRSKLHLRWNLPKGQPVHVSCLDAYRLESEITNRKRGHKPQRRARHATDRGYQIHLKPEGDRPKSCEAWGTNDECVGRLIDPNGKHLDDLDKAIVARLRFGTPTTITCRQARAVIMAEWRARKSQTTVTPAG